MNCKPADKPGDAPMFARSAGRMEAVELRGLVPRDLIDVFDAVSTARQRTRMDLVIEIMRERAEQWVHESHLIQRVTRGNPLSSESDGGSRE
jgi:hypothetical protein